MRDNNGNAALLVGRGTKLPLAVGVVLEGRNRQAVAIHQIDGTEQLPDLLDKCLATLEHDRLGVIGGVGPVGRNLELVEGGGTRVDGLPVGLDDGLILNLIPRRS